MFRWPGTPSPRPQEHELADFAELQAWQRESVSITDVSRMLGRLEENDHSDGVLAEDDADRIVDAAYSDHSDGAPAEDETDGIVGAAYDEIERRLAVCQNGYPFTTDERGYVLRVRQDVGDIRYIVYKYLLLATRLNMSSNRRHAGMDGTLLFEELAAEVVRKYLGTRAQCLVFGTANGQSDFTEKVNELCRQLGEGGGFENRNGAHLRQQDGKLDVVAWKPFTDGLPGQLIAFGQCKTGTNYKDTLAQLQPDAFCNKWLRDSPALTPVRALFIAEALPRSARSGWYNTAVDAGLLFDRCRIVDFCDGISENILDKVSAWTTAAAAATGLTNPNALL